LQIEAMRMGAQINESKAKQQFDQEQTGVKMGADIANNKAKMALQAAQIMENARNSQKGNTPK
jgi:hypothetical protein